MGWLAWMFNPDLLFFFFFHSVIPSYWFPSSLDGALASALFPGWLLHSTVTCGSAGGGWRALQIVMNGDSLNETELSEWCHAIGLIFYLNTQTCAISFSLSFTETQRYHSVFLSLSTLQWAPDAEGKERKETSSSLLFLQAPRLFMKT